jgi:hypothetical protein
MSSAHTERKALSALAIMIMIGVGLLTIPLFLTPPAYLDLALRDAAFGTDLTTQRVLVTEQKTGKTMTAAIHKVGNAFVARLGRINSGSSTYTAQITGYKPGMAKVQAAALQTVRVPVDLTPTFGRLEVATLNAMQTNDPIEATVKDRGHSVSERPQRVVTVDLPPGRHRLSADAPGYCPSERDFEVQAGKITKAVFPLSPDLQEDELARFVLGWRNEPRDLDTHFWQSGSSRFPSPTTVFFQNKVGLLPDGKTFARLDVDEVSPGRYETLTVRRDAAGDYRYFIHVYQGTGTIADAGATVQVYTRGCRVRTLTPPADCAFRIWNVVNVHGGDGDGVTITDVQRCEPEGTIAVSKLGL